MNITRKQARPHRLPSRKLQASGQLPTAPVDLDYGTGGLAYLSELDRGTRGDAERVIKSTARPGHFYVAGNHSTPAGTSIVSITRLDAYGKPDLGFNGSGMVNFNDLAAGPYINAEAVAEDAAGNLFVAVQPSRQSTTHLWKLTTDGKPDPTFGAGKGYVDTRASFDVDLVLTRLACTVQGLVATALRRGDTIFEPVLIALNGDGTRREDFGANGLLIISQLIPNGHDHILDGIAFITPAIGEQRIVVSTYVMRDGAAYAVTNALTLTGDIDQAFADGGHHWSDPWIINNGFTVDDGSKRITFYGQYYSADEDIGQPTLYRLDYSGKPAPEFNEGKVLHFHLDGAWEHIAESNKGLVGFGSFYTHIMAVRYDVTGKLDTNFVPPHGYGQFGARLPEDGFYANTASMATDPDKLRMLVSGRDEQLQAGYIAPCLIAVSLKPQ